LACEGQRFFDIVRQGRAGRIMRAYYEKGYEHIDYNKEARTFTKSRSEKGRYFKDGRNELMPIPEAAITVSNGAMEQNPNY